MGHSVLGKHLVLRMVLRLMVVRWRPQMLLVKGGEALSAAVMDILHMGNEDALFRMAFGSSIVGIRIVTLFSRTVERHAWMPMLPPARTALAGRRGQSKNVLDHRWCRVVFLADVWRLCRLFCSQDKPGFTCIIKP